MAQLAQYDVALLQDTVRRVRIGKDQLRVAHRRRAYHQQVVTSAFVHDGVSHCRGQLEFAHARPGGRLDGFERLDRQLPSLRHRAQLLRALAVSELVQQQRKKDEACLRQVLQQFAVRVGAHEFRPGPVGCGDRDAARLQAELDQPLGDHLAVVSMLAAAHVPHGDHLTRGLDMTARMRVDQARLALQRQHEILAPCRARRRVLIPT